MRSVKGFQKCAAGALEIIAPAAPGQGARHMHLRLAENRLSDPSLITDGNIRALFVAPGSGQRGVGATQATRLECH